MIEIEREREPRKKCLGHRERRWRRRQCGEEIDLKREAARAEQNFLGLGGGEDRLR
jgi:hypothetical protein